MPTFSSALLPTTTGLTFGSAALRWTAYIQDIDIAGVSTITGRFGVKNLEDIRFADQYTGTVTQQIDAALTDISTGLVVVPSSMGAGNATSIVSGKSVLDLRNGTVKVLTNYSSSIPAFKVDNNGYIGFAGLTSLNGTVPTIGTVRLTSSDYIAFSASGNDAVAMSFTPAGVTTIGDPLGLAGVVLEGVVAATGAVTAPSFICNGQITSTLAIGTAPFSVTSTTVVPNLNVAILNGVTISGTPASGNSLVATGTTTASWSTPGDKVESVQYTPATISSIAAAATMMSFSLPANELSVGQALRIIAHGTSSNGTGGGASNTFTALVGANTVFTSAASVIAAGATAGWRMELLLACTAAGGGGTLECSGWLTHISSTPTTTNSVSSLTATIAIDTTSSQTIAIKGNCTVNSASMSITERQLLIERLG